MFYSWAGRNSEVCIVSSWEGLSTKIHVSDNQNRIFSSTTWKKEGGKKSNESFRTSSWQTFIWLFLGKTVIPQENFHFKKKHFHWKIILMEQRRGTAMKDKTTGFSQGEVNAKASGLGLPQSSCRIMGTTPPFAVMFALLHFFAYVELLLFRAGTVSHRMLCTAYCNTCAWWLLAQQHQQCLFLLQQLLPNIRMRRKEVTYVCNTLLIKHYCIVWGCGGMPFHHRTNQGLYTQNQ